jgi:serine/threonine protein kinase
MAPEIYRGDAYGSGVDIYSLGIVLYRLLNEKPRPFLPAVPSAHHTQRPGGRAGEAHQRSASAAAEERDGRLSEIVLKACAYDPKERYSSPMQMRQELEAIRLQPGGSAGDLSPGRRDARPVHSVRGDREPVPAGSCRAPRTGRCPILRRASPPMNRAPGNAAGPESETASDFTAEEPAEEAETDKTESMFGPVIRSGHVETPGADEEKTEKRLRRPGRL